MAIDFRGGVTALGTWGIGKFQSMKNTIQNNSIALGQNASQIRTPSQPVTPDQSVTSLRGGPKYAPAPIPTTDSYSPITMKTDSNNTAQLSKNLSALNGRLTECEDAIRETELAISSNNVDIRFAKNGTAMMHPSDVPLLEKRAATLAEHMTQLKTEKAELVSQHNQLMEKIYK